MQAKDNFFFLKIRVMSIFIHWVKGSRREENIEEKELKEESTPGRNEWKKGQNPEEIYRNGCGLAGKVKHFGDGGSRG